jgi:hypothetical protein
MQIHSTTNTTCGFCAVWVEWEEWTAPIDVRNILLYAAGAAGKHNPSVPTGGTAVESFTLDGRRVVSGTDVEPFGKRLAEFTDCSTVNGAIVYVELGY